MKLERVVVCAVLAQCLSFCRAENPVIPDQADKAPRPGSVVAPSSGTPQHPQTLPGQEKQRDGVYRRIDADTLVVNQTLTANTINANHLNVIQTTYDNLDILQTLTTKNITVTAGARMSGPLDMTGNQIINISTAQAQAFIGTALPSAPAAVLTGQGTTQAPALRLLGLPNTPMPTDTILVLDSSGNVINSGLTINSIAAGGTSGNVPGTIVKRDLLDGGFAAGTITANLLGYHTGNVTGDVIGNLSGVASANVLKTGDTITGALVINNLLAPALQLQTNGTSALTDHVLAIDSSGDITQSVVQIGVLSIAGTSGNVPNTLVLRDNLGDFAAGTITAGLLGNVTGNVSGTVFGNLVGNVTGNVAGNLLGDVTGNLSGTVFGGLVGNVTGNVVGNLLGNVTGNVTGNLVGNVLGDVTGNVVGNLSGAASENVLKVGDTMTGQLRISDPSDAALVVTGQGTTSAPAVRLINNPPSEPSDLIMTIDAQGNVTQSNVPVSLLITGTSFNIPNTLVLRDSSGNFATTAITLNAGSTGFAAINQVGSPTTGLYFPSTTAVALTVNGQQQLVANTTGIGIQGMEPFTQLTVGGRLLQAGSAGTGNTPYQVFVQGRYAYIVNFSDSTLQVFDVSNQDSPTLLGAVATVANPIALHVNGTLAYIVADPGYLQILDVSNQSYPKPLGTLFGLVNPKALYVQGTYAYVIADSGQTFYVIDVSNPSHPYIVGNAGVINGVFHNAETVFVQGRYAYVTNKGDGVAFPGSLQIVDIMDPLNPQLAGSVAMALDASTQAADAQGRYVYVVNAGNDTFQVIDVSKPHDPVVVGTVIIPGGGQQPWDVFAQGQVVYIVANGSSLLYAIDVRDPQNPQVVRSIGTGGVDPKSLYIQGRYAYAMNSTDNRLQIIDLGGAYIQQLGVGGIEAGTVATRSDTAIGGELDVRGGMLVGRGLLVSNDVAIEGKITTTGGFQFYDATSNGAYVGLNAPTTVTATYTLTVPVSQASAQHQVLGQSAPLGQLAWLTATSSNQPTTLVLRDGSGNFAAGIITADVLGNVTGTVVGNVLGNVTGNVVGNLLGDVTGNVVGNVSGAASANVLKSGDTMTGALRIMNTAAPALQLQNLAAATVQEYLLAIDSSGNVTQTAGTIGLLTTSTSANIPNTLVLRDSLGNFAASIITANLSGNVTGNVTGNVVGNLLGNVTGNVVGNVLGDVTGNVTGNLVGNVLGNVTGNVVGNLLGDVTGNVVGNVSGAASANVLKIGDTMTGQLRIMNTTAPALQLLTNSTATAQEYLLAINSSGNVTQTATTVGLLTGATSANIPNTLVLRDSSGNFAAGTITANLSGNVTGNVTGNVVGNLLGNVTGNVVGNVLGDVTGNVTGNLVGNVLGNVTGNVVGNLLGNVTGNVVGNVSGAASANVLKIGDTMTGTLRIMNTTAPALQLLTNSTATAQEYLLAMSSSGNVTQTATTVGLLTGATSAYIPNTLVVRDTSGNFAAGTITANLSGNVTGNVTGNVVGNLLGNVTGNVVGNVLGDVTGNVTGNLVGNVLGNVMGNVVGNLLGDVTGNVVGNVSGAASANVLKTGDTMTGTLRILNPTAPALRLLTNAPATAQGYLLAIDSSGNVTQTATTLGFLTTGTSSNIPSTLVLRDSSGNVAAGTITAGLVGNVTGNVTGNVVGNLLGNVTGTVVGNVLGDVTGNVTGNLVGNVLGNVTGNVAGNLLGNVTGNVVGNVSGAASANVLKIGDTMTGQLRVATSAAEPAVFLTGQATTQAPALRLLQNQSASSSDMLLAIDSSGNVTQSTLPLNLLTQATSSNVPATLVLRDWTGSFAANVVTANGLDVLGTTTFTGQVYNLFANVSPENILYVHKGPLTAPNQFSSVKLALAAITDATTTNRYLISVAPGIYGEDNPLMLQSYVSIIGSNVGLVTIRANNVNQDLLTAPTLSPFLTECFLQRIVLDGATGTGRSAIALTGGELVMYMVNFGSNDIGITVNSSLSGEHAFVKLITGEVLEGASVRTVFDILSTSTWKTSGILLSQFMSRTPQANSTVAKVQGVGSFFYAGNLSVGSPALPPAVGSQFLSMTDGAHVQVGTSSVNGYETAFAILSGATGSTVALSGIATSNNTNDLVITDQQIQGSISGQFDSAKVTIDPAITGLSVLLTEATNGGLTTLAPFNLGRTFGVVTNVAPSINDGTSLGLGVIQGGSLYATTASLVVTVSAGTGYLMQTTDGVDNLQLVSWQTTTTSVAPNTDNFIYINNAGLAQVTLSQPSIIYTIPLGKVRAGATGALFVQDVPDDAAHTATKFNDAFINALGPLYVSGSDVTGSSQLNVTSGRYVLGSHQYAPAGGSVISWQAYLGTTNVFVENQNTVDCQRYDLNGILTAIPAGYLAKHELYVIGGVDSMTGATAEQYALVYSQTVYPDVPHARVGDNPTKPATWTGNIVPIASLIVENSGTPQIIDILDERPTLGFVSSSVAGVTVHGNLLGLLADDHKQYLLVDGSRAMGGPLNMGANTIIGAAQVNGVVVQAHAARHLPNGADPLAVGVPTTISGTLASDAGSANSLSRSDHRHFHGNMISDSLHQVANGTTAGFMRTVDYIAMLNATSNNTFNTLVKRDGNGNVAASTVTANLVGNVTGNVVGNVQGNVTGSLFGNVTGNVAGNLLGNVTGNVVGNVSGAASANVLKVGDTMTGQLRINDPSVASLVLTGHSTTTAPALRLTGNITATNSDNFLAIDGSGNVAQTTLQVGALANGTSSNVANRLVLRDNNGNFAAGTITAGLLGNVTGNVSGQVTGSLFGNATGNVAGNLLGNVTGNVVGNLSGAASANVLQVGDTMTGQLRINAPSVASLVLTGHSTTTAPALRLTGNVTATTNDNFLAIDGSGNVAQTTLQVGALANGTSSNVANRLVLRDNNGNFAAGTITAGLLGNVTGNVSGQVTGSLLGNVTGNVSGNLLGNVTGNVVGNVSGAASANVLKVGDTMTGQLRINDPSLASLVVTGNGTTTAPALRLTGNRTATNLDNFLAIDGSGNVSQTTLQVGALANATSSNVANTLVLRDASGNFATSALTLNSGTTGALALNFAGSAGVGLYSPGTNQLALVVNSAQKLYVNSTGVGIGTSTPTTQLTVGDAYIQQLGAGDIQTGTLTSQANVAVGNNLNVVGGATIGNTLQVTGDAAFGGRVTVEDDLLLYDATGGQYVGLKAPTTVNTSYTLTLPTDQGSATNQVVAQSSTLGQLTWLSATSSNTPSTLVLRDSAGNVAAGTITANILGNVTGNIIGNVLGNLTGNVVGNVSGAASANVLKTGDTMTGQLRMNSPSLASLVVTGHSTTTAPAVRLTGNITATAADNFLAIDGSGNVSQTTTPVGAFANATSSNVANTLVLRDNNGNFAAGTITAGLIGNVTGNLSGQVTGSLLGNVTGNVSGNLLGNVTGNVVGNVTGAASANVLKTGDTMTGQLRINDPNLASLVLTGHSTTTAPALRLTGNLTATNTNNFLAIDGSGNVSLMTSQLGLLANATSSNIPNTLIVRDNSGNFTTSALTLNAGTTGALALNFSGSAGTGLYSPGTNQLAFVVANAQKLSVNSTGVGIGTSAPFTQLTVGGSLTAAGSTGTGLNRPTTVYVQGRYAYVTNNAGASLRIMDVSNATAPLALGSVALSGTPQSVHVQGRYAYVVGSAGLQIVDVSNPSGPLQIGTTLSLGTTPWSIYVRGSYAYVVSYGNSNLQIIDVSNPASPQIVGLISTGFNGPRSVYVQGRYAYVANYGSDNLLIIDVANPTIPTFVSSVSTGAAGSSPYSVYVQGRYAYVANSGSAINTLRVIDVSNPALPTQAGTITIPGSSPQPWSVSVQGRYAYVANQGTTAQGGSTLSVIDVSNPNTLAFVGSVSTGTNGQPWSVFVQGRYAYIANNEASSNTLQIIDLGGAYLQQLETGGIETGTLATRSNAAVGNDLDVRGGAVIGRTLQVTGDVAFDGKVTVTSTLQLLGNSTAALTENLLGIDSSGFVVRSSAQAGLLTNGTSTNVPNTLVARDNSGNFAAGTLLANQVGIATSAPFAQLTMGVTPTLAGSAGSAFGLDSTFVQGRYAYAVSNYSGQMQIIDVSNPMTPATLATVSAGGTLSRSVYVQGRYAYVVNSGSGVTSDATMAIFDVSNPVNPVLLGSPILTGGRTPQAVYVQGRYAYVVNNHAASTLTASLSVIDISDPNKPVVVGTPTLTGGTGAGSFSIFVQGRFAYITNIDRLVIVDIQNPSLPVVVGTLTAGITAVQAVRVQGRYAYVVDTESNQLLIVDVINPASPSIVGMVTSAADPWFVYIQGRYAYITSINDRKLVICDVSNPLSTFLVGEIDLPASGYSLFVQGRYAYMGTSTTGLQIVDLGGAYIQQLEAGGVETGTLATRSNAAVGNDLDVKGGAVIGRSLEVNGQIAAINASGNSGTAFTSPLRLVNVPTASLTDNLLAITSAGNVTRASTVVDATSGNVPNSFVFRNAAGSFAASALTLNSGTTGSPALNFAGSGTTGLYSPGTNQLALVVNSAQKLYANSTGVGIGTTAPFTQLTVDAKLTLAGSTGTGSVGPTSVYVQGRYAYVVNYTTAGTLSVIDVSDPNNLTLVGSLVVEINSNPFAVHVQGRYAYVPTTNGFLYIIDISNPASPLIVGTATIGGTPGSLYVQGRYAYVVNSGGSLSIVDVSNPTNPLVVSTITTGGSAPFYVFVQGRYAYVTNQNSGTLAIIDVSNPNSPSLVKVFATGIGFGVGALYVQGRYAYIVGQTSNLMSIIDISNPSNPALVGSAFGTGGTSPNGVYVQGRYAYVANGGGTLSIIDVGNPSSPVIRDTISVTTQPFSVFVQGRYAYVANRASSTLQVVDLGGSYVQQLETGGIETGTLAVRQDCAVGNDLDVRGGATFGRGFMASGSSSVLGDLVLTNTVGTARGSAATGNFPAAIYVQGRYVYIANQAASVMTIIDVSNPDAPALMANLAGFTSAIGIYVQGRYAYVTNLGANTMTIVDVSNPSSPVIVGTQTGLSGPYRVYVQGRYAYVGNYGSSSGTTMSIVDVSNPAAPNIVATQSGMNGPAGVYVQGRYAYVANFGGSSLSIVDVSNPTAPSIVGTLGSLGGAHDVCVQGRYAYVANLSSSSVSVVDVKDPSNPVLVGTLGNVITPRTISVQGKYLYVPGINNNTLSIIDVSTPSNPLLVGAMKNSGGPRACCVQGRYAYIVNYNTASMQVVDLGGTYIQQLEAGGIESGTVATRSNVAIGNDLDVKGGAIIGRNLAVQGQITAINATGSGTGTANTSPLRLVNIPSGTFGTQLGADANGNVGVFSSSRRFKENIVPLTTEADLLYSLTPVKYDYKQAYGGGKGMYGFIAEDLAQVYPTIINRDNNGLITNYIDSTLHAPTIKQLQKQEQLLKTQQKTIRALLQNNSSLQATFVTQKKTVQDLLATIASMQAQLKTLRKR